jgi:uncharacterized protein (DUF924 family)
MAETRAEAVLEFWLEPLPEDGSYPSDKASLWWRKDPVLDAEIRTRFGADLERLAAGELEEWRKEPLSCLAYIIIADQFSRNAFRDTPRAFALDEHALVAALDALARAQDEGLHPACRSFYRMPLMHSEELGVQEACVRSFEALLDESPEPARAALENTLKYAIAHRDIITRFGRFPHRNAILGRESTPEELAFLQEPGSSF